MQCKRNNTWKLASLAVSLGLMLFSLSCSSQQTSKEGPPNYDAELSRAKAAGPAGIQQLVPLLVSSDGLARRGAMRTLREISLQATRPGAEADGVAVSRALVTLIKTHPDLPPRIHLQLYQSLAVLAPDADVLAGLSGMSGDVLFLSVPVEIGEPLDLIGSGSKPEKQSDIQKGDGSSESLDTYLVQLEKLRKQDHSTSIFAKYDALLASEKPQIRAAALHAMSSMGGTGLFPDYLDCLDSDNLSLRQIGMAALVEFQEKGTTQRLLASWDTSSPRTRGGILRILIRRGDPEGLAMLQRAAREGSVTQRVVALELLGGQQAKDVTPLLLETLGESDVELQAAAAAALTQIAARELDKLSAQAEVAKIDVVEADVVPSRSLLHAVLQACKGSTELRRAMRVLEGCADAESLALAHPLLTNNATREDAARVCVAAAKTLYSEYVAKEILNEIYEVSKSRSTRRSAIDALEELGVSTIGYARRVGFLNEWFLIGGFPKTSKKELGQHPFGAEGPNPNLPFDLKGKSLTWKKRKTKDPDGIYDLRFLKPKLNTAAYAFTILDWPKNEAIIIKAGSDDSIAIWVNGKLVHDNYIPRGVTPDSDRVPVTFRQGPNRILVKIGQGSGGWGFCIRLATKAGKPIDLTQAPLAH